MHYVLLLFHWCLLNTLPPRTRKVWYLAELGINHCHVGRPKFRPKRLISIGALSRVNALRKLPEVKTHRLSTNFSSYRSKYFWLNICKTKVAEEKVHRKRAGKRARIRVWFPRRHFVFSFVFKICVHVDTRALVRLLLYNFFVSNFFDNQRTPNRIWYPTNISRVYITHILAAVRHTMLCLALWNWV